MRQRARLQPLAIDNRDDCFDIRSEDTWDLRGLFHTMIQIEEYNSDDDEESLDQ